MSTNGAIHLTNGTVMPPPGKFKPMVGLPEIVALAATKGEMVSSNFGASEVKLQLIGGRAWYVPMALADQIRTSGIQPRQQLEITKTGKGPMDWKIVPLPAHLGGAPAAAPPQTVVAGAPTAAQPLPTRQHNQNSLPENSSTVRFLAAYKSAVEVLLETKTYAQGRGLTLEIRCEDVRYLAATIIADAKGGSR